MMMTTAVLVVTYVVAVLASLWLFDSSKLPSVLVVIVPAMAAMLIATPKLAWNRDHFYTRLYFAHAPTDNLRRYVASGRGHAPADQALRTVVGFLTVPPGNSDQPTSRWLQAHAQVENSLPARLDVALDLLLVLAGAVVGSTFTDSWTDRSAWTWSSLDAADLAQLVVAVVVAGFITVSQLRSAESHQVFRVKVESTIANDPSAFLSRLPFDDPAFANRFHSDAVDVAAALQAPPPALWSFAKVGGVNLSGRPDGDMDSLTDLGFKFLQLGMGFVLGVVLSFF